MARFHVGDLVVKKAQPIARSFSAYRGQCHEASTGAHGVILSEIMPSSDEGIDALRVRCYDVWFDGISETVCELDIEPIDES